MHAHTSGSGRSFSPAFPRVALVAAIAAMALALLAGLGAAPALADDSLTAGPQSDRTGGGEITTLAVLNKTTGETRIFTNIRSFNLFAEYRQNVKLQYLDDEGEVFSESRDHIAMACAVWDFTCWHSQEYRWLDSVPKLVRKFTASIRILHSPSKEVSTASDFRSAAHDAGRARRRPGPSWVRPGWERPVRV